MLRIAAALFIILAIGILLVEGRVLLVPLVFASFIWFFMKSVADTLDTYVRYTTPLISRFIAGGVFFCIWYIPSKFIIPSIPDLISVMPVYEDNFHRFINRYAAQFSGLLPVTDAVAEPQYDIRGFLTNNFDIVEVIRSVLNVFRSLAANMLLVLVYIMFLFLEQKVFMKKIHAIAYREGHMATIIEVINNINKKISIFFMVKTGTSIVTAVISYIIMYILDIDFAPFWAFLIFVMNFVPNLGSIVATGVPVLIAFVQFDTMRPAVILLISIGILQFIVGSMLEPRLMGNSLNISPFVILISLIIWGNIWGIAGLFLSVPMTVIVAIVLAEFESTRWAAILLSGNGTIVQRKNKYTKLEAL